MYYAQEQRLLLPSLLLVTLPCQNYITAGVTAISLNPLVSLGWKLRTAAVLLKFPYVLATASILTKLRLTFLRCVYLPPVTESIED